jgi:N-acetyl-1-D-myo-inositol-2-amino-2-deoxy-alpha-D-glucopyranoside deacetylase/mycothiol S-conjugate amidase
LIARTAEEGHTSILVTCTNGDRGEVKGLSLHPKKNPEDRRRLAEIRQQELEQATQILGLTHLYPLGYPDSGMDGWESNGQPEAFSNTDLNEVAEKIARLIRQHRPEVLITYNERGGYGHPDHIMAHRAAIAALDVAADEAMMEESNLEPWRVPKVYHTAWARSQLLRTWRWMQRMGRKTPLSDPDFDESKYGTPDEEITTKIEVGPVRKKKWRALFTHKSQMGGNFFWWFFRLTGRWLFAEESLVCVRSDVPIPKMERSVFEGL